jgi:ribosomal protein S10
MEAKNQKVKISKMKIYHVTFVSKNKNSLNSAFLFFLNMSDLNFKIIKKYFKKRTKKSFITILKSPHVNKKAQEQFETRFYSKQLSVYPTKKLEYLFFLKKIQNNVFSDIKLKIRVTTKSNKEKKFNFVTLEPRNYILEKFNKKFISQKIGLNKKKKLMNFNSFLSNNILKIFDAHGELSVTN